MKAVLISGISVGSLKKFSDRLFFLNSSKRHIRLFINKKKHLVSFELAFLFRKLQLLSLIESMLKISVNKYRLFNVLCWLWNIYEGAELPSVYFITNT